ELLVLRDRLGLAADGDDRPGRVVALDEYYALGRLAPGALRGRGHALLAEELDGVVEVTAGLLQGALALHHPRARRVAELLHHCGRDLCHSASSSAGASAGASTGGVSAGGGVSAVAAAGSGSVSACACSDFEPPFFGADTSAGVTFCLPAA